MDLSKMRRVAIVSPVVNLNGKKIPSGKYKSMVIPTALQKKFSLSVEGEPTAIRKKFTLDKDLRPRDGWKSKPIDKWIPIDVMNWLLSVADSSGISCEHMSMHKFNNIKGKTLIKMTEREFLERNSTYGVFLYNNLQDVIATKNSQPPEPPKNALGEVKRGRGRPKGTSVNQRKTKSKRCRLWEFLIKLLAEPQYYSNVIQWEDREKGMFRIKQSEKIAELWGESRGKSNMDYVKMSRLMRYYYKNKELVADKQRLVYKFGPKATGWRSQSMESME